MGSRSRFAMLRSGGGAEPSLGLQRGRRRGKRLVALTLLGVVVGAAVPPHALATHSPDPVVQYLQVQQGIYLDLPSDGTTVGAGLEAGFRKSFDVHGALLSTSAAPAATIGTGSSSKFACIHDKTRTGFAPLPIKSAQVNNSEEVTQHFFYPYRQRNARTINGVSQLQYLICANGGTDGQNGIRSLQAGPGIFFKNSSTTRKIGQQWRTGTTPSSYTISLGFQVGTGPVNISGSISQTPQNVLKGSTVGPYASDLDTYARNAAVGWWDADCGFLCHRLSGSADLQGSVVEALWEFPMPSTSTTYRFGGRGFRTIYCSNPLGC